MASRKSSPLPNWETLLRDGHVALLPLVLEVEGTEVPTPFGGRPAGAEVTLGWGRKRFRFVAECKQSWTPQAVAQMAAEATRLARPPDSYPLIITSYLPDERLQELQAEGVSGIDLCGNGVVVVPGELLVYRTGQPNRFRSESAIKNVFRGESSLIARVFLVRPQFDSVQQVQSEIARRGGKVALSTVSKACKALEAMLGIGRRKREGAARPMGLLQAEKLLDSLAANATLPVVRQAIRGKARLGQDVLRERLILAGGGVQSGMSSVGSYAVMAKEAIREYYCPDLDTALLAVGDAFEQTERFADMVLLETRESTAYFDRRADLVASPVQVYLELMLGDKRSRETAEQVRKYILDTLKAAGEA